MHIARQLPVKQFLLNHFNIDIFVAYFILFLFLQCTTESHTANKIH